MSTRGLVFCFLCFLFPSPVSTFQTRPAGRNVFLEGPFRPVIEEKSVCCRVNGTVPDSVRESVFARVGPNPRFAPPGGYHLFDGDGMVHWVTMSSNDGGSTALYHNRYIRTEKLAAETRAGRSLYVNVGDFAKPLALMKIAAGVLLKAFALIPDIPRSRMSVANTNIVKHGDGTLALCESGLPYAVELSDSGLRTTGVESFDGFLKESLTAHPKTDPITGKIYGFCGAGGGSKDLRVVVFHPDGSPSHSYVVHMRACTLMHDFAITSENLVILDMPLVFSAGLLFQGKIPVEFDATRTSRLGVLDLDDTTGSSLRWYEIPGKPFMVSHVVNAHVEHGVLTLLTCDMETICLKRVCDSVSVLHRTTVNLGSGEVSRRPLLEMSDKSMDFPVINPTMTGRSNRYAYVTRLIGGVPGIILKIDVMLGKVVGEIVPGPGEFTGECCFVSDGPEEDSGYIMSFVSSESESRLGVWCARDMSSVCSIHIPSRIPIGFHSNVFVPKSK